MIYRGYKLTAFQQFRGAWIARYEALPKVDREVRATGIAGDIGATTKRSAIAQCKAEVFHIHRSVRIRASGDSYYAKLSRRFRARWQQPNFGRTG